MVEEDELLQVFGGYESQLIIQEAADEAAGGQRR